MTTQTTIPTASGPTLADGLPELARIAEAQLDAEAMGCGVRAIHARGGQLLHAEPCESIPLGVIECDELWTRDVNSDDLVIVAGGQIVWL